MSGPFTPETSKLDFLRNVIETFMSMLRLHVALINEKKSEKFSVSIFLTLEKPNFRTILDPFSLENPERICFTKNLALPLFMLDDTLTSFKKSKNLYK